MSAQTASKKPLRLALLGAGTFAKSAHFAVISPAVATGRVSIALVWSRTCASATALAAFYGESVPIAHADGDTSTTTASVRKALTSRRDQLDAVIIAAPIPQLAELTHVVLEIGLPVLCEKPIAHDVSTARQLISRWCSVDVLYAVAENFRFEPVFRRAFNRIPTVCGRVLALTLMAQNPMAAGSRYGRGWRLKLPSAGVLVDGTVHHIAALRILAGADVTTVSARCSSVAEHFEGCDTAVATLGFANGLSASMCASYAGTVFKWEVIVVGETGDISVSRIPGKPGYMYAETTGDGKTEELIPFSGLDREFDAFFNSVENGKMDEDLEASVAFNDIATVEAMFESSSQSRTVQVAKLKTVPTYKEESRRLSSR